MKKISLYTVVLMFSLLLLVGCNENKETTQTPSKNTLAVKGSLKVGMDATFRPMEWQESGQLKGFDVDLVNALGKELGRDIELNNVAWDDIFDKLYAGNYDLVVSAVSINEDRKKSMLFSQAYFDSMPLIVTRKDSDIKAAKDLSKKKIGVQNGTTAHDLISKNIAGVIIKKYDGGTDALNDLIKKDLDAVVIDSPVALDFVKQNGSEYIAIEDKNFFPQEQFGIAASKVNDALIDEINTALTKLKSNGEYQKIYDKYFKTK